MITGRCFCGAVQFQFTDPPIRARACWCRDCQYLSCGNASINATFRTASLTRSGDITTYVSQSDAGTTVRRSFCPTCGTPLFSQGDLHPDLIVVRAGALDDPAIATPQSYIWADSAPDWGKPGPHVPSCPAAPPP